MSLDPTKIFPVRPPRVDPAPVIEEGKSYYFESSYVVGESSGEILRGEVIYIDHLAGRVVITLTTGKTVVEPFEDLLKRILVVGLDLVADPIPLSLNELPIHHDHSHATNQSWTTCPECGTSQDHKPQCSRGRRPWPIIYPITPPLEHFRNIQHANLGSHKWMLPALEEDGSPLDTDAERKALQPKDVWLPGIPPSLSEE